MKARPYFSVIHENMIFSKWNTAVLLSEYNIHSAFAHILLGPGNESSRPPFRQHILDLRWALWTIGPRQTTFITYQIARQFFVLIATNSQMRGNDLVLMDSAIPIILGLLYLATQTP